MPKWRVLSKFSVQPWLIVQAGKVNLPATMLWNFQIMHLCICSCYHPRDHCHLHCTSLNMVLQVLALKHSSLVCRQHPADKLKAGEQCPPPLPRKKEVKNMGTVLVNNRNFHVEDERLSSGRTFVFLSELPVNYSTTLSFCGKVKITCSVWHFCCS